MSQVTPAFPSKRYDVIVADPAWSYSNERLNGAASNHYATMTNEEVFALPVRDIAKKDSALFLWTTWPHLETGLKAIETWGFDYVTGLPWIKVVEEPGSDLFGSRALVPTYGTGFWVRGCSEPLLIARRGGMKAPRTDFVGLLSENFQHSRKPENVYEVAEQCGTDRIELFARRCRDGWDSWGLEASREVAAT